MSESFSLGLDFFIEICYDILAKEEKKTNSEKVKIAKIIGSMIVGLVAVIVLIWTFVAMVNITNPTDNAVKIVDMIRWAIGIVAFMTLLAIITTSEFIDKTPKQASSS